MQDISKANMFMSTQMNAVDTEYFILFKEKKPEIIQKRLQTFWNIRDVRQVSMFDELRITDDRKNSTIFFSQTESSRFPFYALRGYFTFQTHSLVTAPNLEFSMIDKEIADLKERFQKEHDHTLQERIRQDYESLESFIQQLA